MLNHMLPIWFPGPSAASGLRVSIVVKHGLPSMRSFQVLLNDDSGTQYRVV